MRQLKQDRSLIVYLLLTIITFGIYGLIFIHGLAKDTNEACKEDGKNTPGLLALILLSLITCGIYSIIWQYKLVDRLNAQAIRNGQPSIITGGGYLCWSIVGSLLCGIGPLVAFHKLCKSANQVMANYNAKMTAA